MTDYTYKPLETLPQPPSAATAEDCLRYIEKLTAAIHELNSKIEYVAESATITIPPSGG